MNLILLLPEDFEGPTRVRLQDDRAAHIRDILRSYVGQTLKVGRLNGPVGRGQVVAMTKKEVVLDVMLNEEPPRPVDVSLILGLPRPQTLKKVLESTAAIGIRRIALVGAEQVEKSFFSSRLLKDKAWERHQRLGLEQGGRTLLPGLSLHRSLRVFLDEDWPSWEHKDVIRLVCHPGIRTSLWDTPLASSPHSTSIVAAIGPEGGWRDEEVTLFETQGFQTVTLGLTLHRVENAVTSLLGQIELLQMRCRAP